jgi:hypothetical protein
MQDYLIEMQVHNIHLDNTLLIYLLKSIMIFSIIICIMIYTMLLQMKQKTFGLPFSHHLVRHSKFFNDML